MSIAQRIVAGEGELHPTNDDSIKVEVDSAALTAFRCDSTNLPWIIFRAAFRAAHIEEIPARARAVLSALARTVDAANPFAAIFARRELLTGRALQSMRTFYRSLDDLEVAGLIERRPQRRYVEAGLFGRAYIHLTDHAATLLGFNDSKPEKPTNAPAPDASTSIDTVGASFTQPSANLADGAIYKDLSPSSFQKRQPGQPPQDLQRLRTLGFLDFLIFKLMREARENGKRLSDVVEVTWEHLRQANAPINYLRTLLRSPVDFGHQLRLRDLEKADRIATANNEMQANQTARESAGLTFVDVACTRKFVVGADGEMLTIYHLDEGVARHAGAGWRLGFRNALERGQIRPAVAADLEVFEQSNRASAVQERGQRPLVTAEIRGRIANLRSLLEVRVARRTA